MGHETGGEGIALPDGEKVFVEPIPGYLVQSSERLVQKQDGRSHAEGAGDRGPHFHSTGKLPGEFHAGVLQADEFQRFADPLPPLRAFHAPKNERQFHVGGRPPPGQEIGVLKDQKHLFPGRGRRRSGDPNRSLARRNKAGNQPKQGGFSAPARSDKADEVALVDREIDSGQDGRPAAEALSDLFEQHQGGHLWQVWRRRFKSWVRLAHNCARAAAGRSAG